jgi:hypothetical protein
MPDPTTTEPTPAAPPKPGIRTTEFWLSLLATAIGAGVATGLIPSSGEPAKIAAFGTMVLAALGYTVMRSQVKS